MLHNEDIALACAVLSPSNLLQLPLLDFATLILHGAHGHRKHQFSDYHARTCLTVQLKTDMKACLV